MADPERLHIRELGRFQAVEVLENLLEQSARVITDRHPTSFEPIEDISVTCGSPAES